MNLDVDSDERDTLIIALGQLTTTNVSGIRDRALGLLKRLAILEPDPDPGTLDVSSPGVTGCTGCNTWLPAAEFHHKPGCPWLAKYGTSRDVEAARY